MKTYFWGKASAVDAYQHISLGNNVRIHNFFGSVINLDEDNIASIAIYRGHHTVRAREYAMGYHKFLVMETMEKGIGQSYFQHIDEILPDGELTMYLDCSGEAHSDCFITYEEIKK